MLVNAANLVSPVLWDMVGNLVCKVTKYLQLKITTGVYVIEDPSLYGKDAK